MSIPEHPPAVAPAALPRKGSRWRRLAALVLKVGIATALLSWLMASGRLEFTQLRAIAWSARTLVLALAGVAAVWLGFLLLSWRLCLMVREAGIDLPLRSAVALTSIGAFSGAMLPGVVGGDLVKVVYLCRGEASGKRTAAMVAVMCDRALGMLSLFLLGTVVTAGAAATGTLPFRSPVLFIAPALVLAAAILLAVYAARRRLGTATVDRLGGYLPAHLRRGASLVDHYLRRPRLLAGCVALAAANHFLVCCTFIIAADLLGGAGISVLHQLLISPLAMALNAVPITPGGVGISESAFSFLYEKAGCSLGAAIGILGRAVQYVAFAAAGFPAMVVRGRGRARGGRG